MYLNAKKSASIAPANASVAAVAVEGHAILYGFKMTTGNFASVFAYNSGYAQIAGAEITGPGIGLQISDNAGGKVYDSRINVAGFAAVNLYAGGEVEIDSVTKIGGLSGVTLTGGTDGIYCGQGGVAFNAMVGPITLSGSGRAGIETQGCTIKTNVVSGSSIAITGNGFAQSGGGVTLGRGSEMDIFGISITNNAQYAVQVYENASTAISGATITGNGGVAIQSDQNAVVHFENYDGINTVSAPSGNTNVLFGCYQGGKIFVDQISGTITPPPTSQNQGCLTIGGP